MLKEFRDFASFFGLLCLLYFWQSPANFASLSTVGVTQWSPFDGSLQQVQNNVNFLDIFHNLIPQKNRTVPHND